MRRRPNSYKDKVKAGQRKRPRTGKGASPKPSSKRPPPSTAHKKVEDRAPCTVCGMQLWDHPRCIDCERFMWCTAQQQTAAGLVHSSGGCPVEK